MTSTPAQPNFYLWGAWKAKTIKEPFLTKKVNGPLKKIVLGEAFIIALKEKGQVVTWGRDAKHGCLGLGDRLCQVDQPQEIEGLNNVTDIQMGANHVVALTSFGEVFCWGEGKKGQLGNDTQELRNKPQKVEKLAHEQIMQIAVVKNSTFALSSSGVVYGWGDNEDNTLGLEEVDRKFVETPMRLSLLGEMRVRKLEIFEGRTIIAHVHAQESDGVFDYEYGSAENEEKNETEVEIFKGIDEMRKCLEKTQEWWNHLQHIRHGRPSDIPHDTGNRDMRGDSSKQQSDMDEDMEVDMSKLIRAEKHLDALVSAAVAELRRTQQMPGTRNVRLILCMFIDETRLRREKVKRTIAARKLVDAKRATQEISAYSVTDFGANANEEIRKIIAVTKVLQNMLDKVRGIENFDMATRHLKETLEMCLECKLQLHDTLVELLKAAESKPSDPMLPALRIIKDRWNSLKNCSLYALYMDCENKRTEFSTDDAHLEYLVKASNNRIDEILDINKERIISHDTLVPALCYDLLRENAELRKMTNSYQLHVLMLHQNKHISNANVGIGKISDDNTRGNQRAIAAS